MHPVTEEPTSRARVLAVRALPGLGDMLMLEPALRALRASRPDARIELVGLPSSRWMLQRYPRLLDGFQSFPGFPGLPEQPVDPPHIAAFLLRANAAPADLALQLHGSGSWINPFVQLLGARRTMGLGQVPELPEGWVRWEEHEHEARRLLAVVEQVGAPEVDPAPRFPVTDDDRTAALVVLAGEQEPYACVHPGASVAVRRWPAEHYVAVGRELAASGLRVYVTGSGPERALAECVADGIGAAARSIAGETSLGALAAIHSAATIVVSNDTGAGHLAVAAGAPTVLLYQAHLVDRWAPLDRDAHAVVEAPPGASIAEIPPAAVIEVVRARLDATTRTHGSMATIGAPDAR